MDKQSPGIARLFSDCLSQVALWIENDGLEFRLSNPVNTEGVRENQHFKDKTCYFAF